MSDIRVEIVTEEIVQNVEVCYSTLKCKSCLKEEKIKGDILIPNVPNGWGTLDLNVGMKDRTQDWLLCPSCVDRVKAVCRFVR